MAGMVFVWMMFDVPKGTVDFPVTRSRKNPQWISRRSKLFKKMLITMLVLVAATSAMAGDMDWKFYGKLHTSLDYLSDGEEAALYLASNTSRFGFKGGTELNENFTFIWQFESAINMAQKGGFTGLANRNTYLGLKGKFGKFIYGIHDTPFKTLGRKVEFFYDELGDFRHATMGWDRRLQDVLAWASPDWSGFGIFAAYQLDQADDHWDKSMTAYSVLASYSKDAFYFGAALEGLSDSYQESYLDANDELVFGDAATGMRFAGKYTGEKFAVSALYQMLSNWYGEFDGTTWEGLDSTTFGIGALFQAAEKWAVKGQFYLVNPYTDAEDDPNTTDVDESDINGTFIALGVDHNVTKAVKFYVQMVTASNGELGWGIGGQDFSDMGIDQSFTNGHGRSMHAASDPTDGKPKNPMGFSVGSVIKF